jgi:hypothetical protein
LLAPVSPEDGALLAELLSLPTEGRFPPLQLTPQRKKEKTFEALLRQLEALARQRPVLMLFEDVHWIDPSGSRRPPPSWRRELIVEWGLEHAAPAAGR